MPERNDITHRKFGNIITTDLILTLSIGLFLGGIAWQAMAGDVKAAINQTAKVAAKQDSISKEIGEIKVEVGKNATKLDSQAEDITELKGDVRAIRRLLEGRR